MTLRGVHACKVCSFARVEQFAWYSETRSPCSEHVCASNTTGQSKPHSWDHIPGPLLLVNKFNLFCARASEGKKQKTLTAPKEQKEDSNQRQKQELRSNVSVEPRDVMISYSHADKVIMQKLKGEGTTTQKSQSNTPEGRSWARPEGEFLVPFGSCRVRIRGLESCRCVVCGCNSHPCVTHASFIHSNFVSLPRQVYRFLFRQPGGGRDHGLG